MRPDSDADRPMRIAFVTTQYPPHDAGGIGSYVQSVSSAFARAGHQVTVVCSAEGQERSSTVEGPGVTVERFPIVGPSWLWRRWRRPEPERQRVLHALSSRWALRQLSGEFDIVEVPEWKAQGLLLSGPVVVHLHLPLPVRTAWAGDRPPVHRAVSHALERLGALRAARVTSTSVITSTMPDGSSWPGRRTVQVVSPPIDLGEWDDRLDVRQTDPVALFVGRLETRKAPEQLIEALARVRDEVPDARAVFVGRSMRHSDGRSYRTVLEELALRSGVPCEFHDPVSDQASMQRFYEQARVVAVPSGFEPLSLVVFEALACGRPVVLSDRVGAGEWLGDLDGAVVPYGDVEGLAAAIAPHLRAPEHAARVGDVGRRQARSVCAEDALVESRLAVYRAVRQERQRAAGGGPAAPTPRGGRMPRR